MLTGKESKKRKKGQVCKVKKQRKNTVKTNCKGKRIEGKENKGIHVGKIIAF